MARVDQLLNEYISLMIEKIRTQKRDDGTKGKFNLAEFQKLQTVKDMNEYAKRYLEPIGKGSSRIVYVLSSKYALKIALDEKGVAQNKAELKVSSDVSTSQIIARVHKRGTQDAWLISDLVRPVKSGEEFEKLSGEPWLDFAFDIEDAARGKDKNNVSPFLRAIVTMMNKHKLGAGDVRKIEHWGKTPDGRVVILDYGFDNDVYVAHYKEDQMAQIKADGEASTDKATRRPSTTLPKTV